MQALFIGHTYIDVTVIADQTPVGDEKALARDYAVSFGGNAVTAAFACAKLGAPPDLLTTVADDWLGHMFVDMCRGYRIPLHPRHVPRSSISLVTPRDGKRAILRLREDRWIHPWPMLNLDGCRALHLDGHQPDAALHYAKVCREKGILTSLDGGGLRENTDELMGFIDVAVVAERLCEQMELSDAGMLAYLRRKGCRVGAVTQGERGVLWYAHGGPDRRMEALPVPFERVIDTNGAGDIFHGAYVRSYLARPEASWEEHFRFARAASAYAVQRLGNEASLPAWDDVTATRAEFGDPA